MRTWDDWSDFEVNKAVAVELSLDDGEVGYFDSNEHLVPDYCNSWADMGPLIVESKICIEPKALAFTPEADDWVATDYNIENQEVNRNPLRAAAIVFLMMNGVKP